MRKLKSLMVGMLVVTCLAAPLTGFASEAPKDNKAAKAKPYPLKTCLVSGEELGKMGDAYVFTQDGREIKLCCKGCLKDFNKNKAKYLKKLDEAEKKAKKSQ